CPAPTSQSASSARMWLMAMALATSPALYPPMPSASTAMWCWSSTTTASSLFPRMSPGSVRLKYSNFKCWSVISRLSALRCYQKQANVTLSTNSVDGGRHKKKATPGGRCIFAICRRPAASVDATRSEQRLEQLAHLGGVVRDLETALFHDGQLGIGRVGTAGDQCTGMAHALAGRRRDASDEADHGLLHVGLAPQGGFRLVGTADFADHDDGIGVGVVVEGLHHVNVLEAVDGVTTDTDGR